MTVARGRWSTMLAVATISAVLAACVAVHDLYLDRSRLPDISAFLRFEFPTIGHVYDARGTPLIEFANESRQITQYTDIPPIVRDAILAAEDKHFFSHAGVDYTSLLRVVSKAQLRRGGPVFSQGGSTLTQQLVRGLFLGGLTSQEQGSRLLSHSALPRAMSTVIGAPGANRLLRKAEEVRLSVWLEQQMRDRFGSRLRAKQELFARYASVVYMGNGQYGFAKAADYYFGRPLSTFTVEDADKAALLAGIMKAPRDYAPSARDAAPVLRRRNQILTLMAAAGFLSASEAAAARARPLPPLVSRERPPSYASAAVEHVLDELRAARADLSLDDLLQGRFQVYSTVDARVQQIVGEALERGLDRYEQRHARARGIVQGSVVVLKNRDGSILAEAGGRQIFRGRPASYTDFNRARQSLRQPGSAMKPIVYLAAFQSGQFTLETLVPDEPISVPDQRAGAEKWIANYDGLFKGLIPIREAFAESRNTVAVWITRQVGIDPVLNAARSLGVETPLKRYASTALGASEMSLLDLATAYRTLATGVRVRPHVLARVMNRSGEDVLDRRQPPDEVALEGGVLSLIQEGLRGVVRIPGGTAHALAYRLSPIAVMGKTGTTSEFRDAIFVGSTYGLDGITVAVRIGFDDNRSLGQKETGGQVAMPVFEDVIRRVYRDRLVGPAPVFPKALEQRISSYLAQLVPAAVR